MNTKTEIRAKYKNLRNELSFDEINNLSNDISLKISNEFTIENKKISIFLPIKKLKEVDTKYIIENLKKSKNQFYVSKSNFETFEMKHYKLEETTRLETNDFGILEPIEEMTEINEKELDYVIVPLLAYNKTGHRIGYGKGFYDRFLSKCSSDCKFIGVSFFDTIEEFSEISENDIRLHFCATPTKILEF